MSFIADLHIHSHYSRSTSRDMNLPELHRWAQIKGVDVVGTGDFTHPQWLKELHASVVPVDDGLFKLKDSIARERAPAVPASCKADVSFILTAEISCIYKRNGRTRRVHNLLFCPDFNAVNHINKQLAKIGNLSSDGRPILKLDSEHLLEIALESSEKSFLVPAHAWTPHFSIFGQFTGFESLEECFGSLAHKAKCIETGLSSDPPMNRLVPMLDNIALMSNSDAHSPSKLAREANILNGKASFDTIFNTYAKGDAHRIESTIEFFPEEGKYHFDGHRDCGVSLSPVETTALAGLCPACGKQLTIGVFSRIKDLSSGRENCIVKEKHISLIPLNELIADALGTSIQTKKVAAAYASLTGIIGNELHILRFADKKDIEEVAGGDIACAVMNARAGNVNIIPGYDGVYGKISAK